MTGTEHRDPTAGELTLQDRAALRRVVGLSTELADISEVEYRQLRLERVVLVGVWTQGSSADAEASLAELPDEQVKAVIDVQGASTYVAAIEQAAGAELAPDAGAQAQAAAGQKAFQEWLADNDIAMDLRFGVTIDSGAATPADTSLSFPAGEIAGLADAEQPDADFAAGLPETQRCG